MFKRPCKLLCQLLFGIVLSFVGYVLFEAYKRGEFEDIPSLGLEKCKSIPMPNKVSCEDIQSLSDNSLLLTCGHLTDVFQLLEASYIPYYNYQNLQTRVAKLPKSKKGEMYLLTPDSKYSKPQKLSLSGYVHPDFHPHGMSVVRHKNDDFVFIVNHRRDGEFITVFKVDQTNKKLKYWTSISSDAFLTVNNVAVVPDSNGNFYFTNWLKNDPGSYSGTFEMLLKKQMKASSVGFCETPKHFLERRPGKNLKAECRLVSENMSDANGVTLTNDGKRLYVVNGAQLFEYAVGTDNELRLRNEIEMKYLCDNVNASPTDENMVYVACFPKALLKMAGSMFSVDTRANKVKPLVIDVDNRKITASTAVFKVGKYGVIASIFDDQRYLVCDL